MVNTKIPTILRSFTNGEASVLLEVPSTGVSLRAFVGLLDDRFPGIANRMLEPDGGLLKFVNVYVDGEDVRFTGGLNTVVNQDSEVYILPAVAGG